MPRKKENQIDAVCPICEVKHFASYDVKFVGRFPRINCSRCNDLLNRPVESAMRPGGNTGIKPVGYRPKYLTNDQVRKRNIEMEIEARKERRRLLKEKKAFYAPIGFFFVKENGYSYSGELI